MKSLHLVLAWAATQRTRRAQPPIATVLTEALGYRYGSRFISWPSSIVSIRPSQESIGVPQRCTDRGTPLRVLHLPTRAAVKIPKEPVDAVDSMGSTP